MGYVWIFQRPPHRIFPTELQFSNRMLISFFHCLPQHLAIPAIESEFPAERITYSRISLPEECRADARLDREVTVVGNGDRLVVWDRATHDARKANVRKVVANFFDN